MKIPKVWIDSGAVYIQIKNKTYSRNFDDFPLLKNATQTERAGFEVGKCGIRWNSIDEDLSYDGFIKPIKHEQWQ